MSAAELINLRDKYRVEYAAACDQHIAPFIGVLELFDRAIGEKFEETAQIAFEKAGKTDGKVSVDLPDGLKLSASVAKRVDWDQDKLKDAAKNLSWEDVQHYFDISFKVGEKIYKALPPSSELKAKLDAARTIKLSPMKLTLERKDAAPTPGG
jgi:hypothetical protein